MRLTIQTKLVLLLAGLVGLVLLGVLVAVSTTLDARLREQTAADFKQTQLTFQRIQTLRYEKLVETASLLRENAVFKANLEIVYLEKGDTASLYFSVSDFARFITVDIIAVTDTKGKLLAWLDDPLRRGEDLSKRESIARAMTGEEPPLEPVWPDLWAEQGVLYQVASVPIYAGESELGTLTLGTKLAEKEARDLKGSTAIDVSFLLADKTIATTLDSSLTPYIAPFAAANRNKIDQAIKDTAATAPFTATVSGVPVSTFISPLGIGERAYYFASVPESVQLATLTSLQRTILFFIGFFLVASIAVAVLIGGIVSKPVRTLATAMTKVKAGDLSVSVAPTTKDEIGELAQNFNEMTGGLRERFQLMKYVGSHTIEMIQQTSGAEARLGGSRQEVTVLFSDVRGFTAFSENRTPEEVVAMLNRYLGFQSDLVTKHGGSVDKFVGDEMVALFTGERAAKRAVLCAVEIQRRVEEEHKMDPSPIDIGIGINSGSVVMGNMGASDRMDYTVIGAAVNLGARLCSAAKAGQILIRKDLLESEVMMHGNGVAVGGTTQMSFKGFSTELEIAEVLV
ncbi:MAG: HAMP domain-containing protein [Rhizobacter sp.]|nr:HAMP domain-containing protein [Chlorobiales bacterium]